MKHFDRFLMRLALWVMLGLVLSASASAQNSTPWPQVPLPPRANVQWIADDMKVDGIPMRVMRFDSQTSREEVAAYYTAHWSGGYPTKPSVTTSGNTTVVGQAHGPYYMTVKVREEPHQHSSGWIAVSQMLGNKVELAAGGLPIPPGAKIMSVVESRDPGKWCRQLVISYEGSVDNAINFYEAALNGAGWEQIQKTWSAPPGVGPRAALGVYQRDQSQLAISVTQAKGQRTSIMATLVTNDTVAQAQ